MKDYKITGSDLSDVLPKVTVSNLFVPPGLYFFQTLCGMVHLFLRKKVYILLLTVLHVFYVHCYDY